ncbi:hypothetical protein ACVDHH_09755 [Staphylococcus saprophyticus]
MSYPTDMDFMVNVTMELIQNIERMAHHPSLILLFRNNEIDMTYTMLTSDGHSYRTDTRFLRGIENHR